MKYRGEEIGTHEECLDWSDLVARADIRRNGPITLDSHVFAERARRAHNGPKVGVGLASLGELYHGKT